MESVRTLEITLRCSWDFPFTRMEQTEPNNIPPDTEPHWNNISTQQWKARASTNVHAMTFSCSLNDISPSKSNFKPLMLQPCCTVGEVDSRERTSLKTSTLSQRPFRSIKHKDGCFLLRKSVSDLSPANVAQWSAMGVTAWHKVFSIFNKQSSELLNCVHWL